MESVCIYRNVVRSRSRSPEWRWGGRTTGEFIQPFQNSAADGWVRDGAPIPQRDYPFNLQGHDFGERILNEGVGWPYSHANSTSHGVHIDEIRESSNARGLLDSSNGRRPKKWKTKRIPCKFYVQGHCHHGSNCRYLHDIAVRTSAHGFSGYDKGSLNSQGIFRTDTREHNGLQLNCADMSQNDVFPSEDFGSQPSMFLIRSQTSETGSYVDKGQSSSHVFGVHNGMDAANLATMRGQMHQNSLVHPQRLGDYVINESTQHQTMQELSVATYPRIADRVGASIFHDAAREEAHNTNPYLPPLDGKALLTAAPVGKQSYWPNRDPRLMIKLSAAPPPVPPTQHEAAAVSVPSAGSPPVPPIQQEAVREATRDGNTLPEIPSRSVEVSYHAAQLKNFKSAVADFVKVQLKKTWHSGKLTKEIYKVIVQKVVENVTRSEEHIPETREEADEYPRCSSEKINELIKVHLFALLLSYFIIILF